MTAGETCEGGSEGRIIAASPANMPNVVANAADAASTTSHRNPCVDSITPLGIAGAVSWAPG